MPLVARDPVYWGISRGAAYTSFLASESDALRDIPGPDRASCRFAGALGPLVSPSFFVSSQLPHEPQHPLFPSEQILALQLGNAYFLLGLLGVFVLNTTTETAVINRYIWALWIADIGHVGVTAWAMGMSRAVDVRSWNALAWGNIGVTCFLFATRTLYLLGAFGVSKPHASASRARKVH